MPTPDSILIVAGEASADTHGARVLAALRQSRPDVTVFGVGGAAMRAEGLETIIPAEEMALAGLTEVLSALPRMWRNMQMLVALARTRRPKVAVLIDLPDFNLRLAKRLKALGIHVIYYISPQVWAWRQGRVKHIRAVVDQMLVILPFEETFYRDHGVPVQFVGHPLVEQLPAKPDVRGARAALGLPLDGTPIVALLPGSRHKEITRHLPDMLAGVRELQATFPALRAVLPVASTISRALIDAEIARAGVDVMVVEGQATQVLSAADVAVVCSGTATLQAALLERPMVVVYRVSWLTHQILKRLIKVAHIALVNLIAGKRLVPELVQAAFTSANVAHEVRTLLLDAPRRVQLGQHFAALRGQLGGGDTAGEVARVVLRYLEGPKENIHV